MNQARVAIRFTSILLFLTAAAGRQDLTASQSRAFPQSSSSEPQNEPCQPKAPTPTTPFDTCKYLPPGPGIHTGRPLSAPDPEYPDEARKAKLSGTVVMVLAVNEKGGIDDVKVIRSSDRRFEQKAMEAGKQWQFMPATKDDKPVAVQISVDVSFRLR